MKKIAILVDVQNVYYTTRQAFGRQFNYSAFWEEVAKQGEIISACAYATEPANAKQKGFQQILSDLGFEVKRKPYIQRKDGSAKADWDVGIALDLMDAAPIADEVILASGDGDFDLAIQRANERFPAHTKVYGVRQLTAESLIRSADSFRPIDESLLMPEA